MRGRRKGRPFFQSCFSGYDFLYDLSVNVSQAEVTAVIAIGESLVIETQLMENGGVEVMHMDLPFHGVVAIGVSISMGDPWFESTSGKPDSEPVRIVITTSSLVLSVGRASEFASPPYNSVLQ